MTRFTGVHHLALVTGDMDRTVRFWRDLLGLRLVTTMGRKGYRHYFFQLSERDLIAFFEWPGVQPMAEKDHGAPISGRVGFDHVSLGVERQDDLFDLKDRLAAAGFWVSEVVDHGFVHSLYTFDPNNIPIEFSHALVGRDPRQKPMLGDHEPSDVVREGPEPQKDAWPAVTSPTPPAERRIYPAAGSEYFHGRR